MHSMRVLVLLSVVALSFVLLRCWTPGESGSADPAAATSNEGVRFLSAPVKAAEPEPRTAPVQEERSPAAPPSAPPSTAPETPPVDPRWAAEAVPQVAGEGGELRVAAALVHGKPPEVQAAAATLPEPRARLVEAFAWALAGERQMALDLSKKIAKDSVPSQEGAYLEAALTGRAAVPAASAETSISRAMEMVLLSKAAREALAAGRYAEAAGQYSDLLVGELGAPWAADPRVLTEWTQGLNEAQRRHRWNPRGEWPGAELTVQSGESLIAVRKRFLAEHPEAIMCTGLIERANDVQGFLQPGQKLRIPTEPVRIYVDLEARWALYFFGDEVAAAWPVGIGRPGEETPPGDYTVKDKIENPPWMKVGQEAIPYGDPRNPLGSRWLGWAQDGHKTSYGFHGTTQPESIGKAESDGCVRFRNEDVQVLFQILPEGAPIHIQG